ncbi:coproporphyrinogen-III oxidase family protein [Cyanobium sp. T1G-Tous]|uniref:coproporphyrinogen-III oxidase family protein n=1 Tax=Cyanobium sp. T1G-Tous TaxID=2823722 RepID=UPI0020CEDFAF|nr:coproporphyrinogen-III oxidase family protein [Cyanobium sp. T1G-Tous]
MHIPFCHRRCFYCDFPVVPLGDRAGGEAPAPGSASIAAYLSLLLQEIAASPPGPPLATVYFGGGTPSLLTPPQLAALLAALSCRFGLAPGAEISLELDPASFDQDRLAGYLQAGVNRVSLGGQSFDDAVLAGLGRRHRGADLLEAAGWLAQALAGGALSSWSLDLIQGLPGQDLGHWRCQLRQAIALAPPHLSVYDLTLEPGTVFAQRHDRGQLQLPDADLGADLMELTWAELSAAGYGHYEISNYALPGHASRHNRVYWSGAGWWGFGMGATAAPWGERLARPRTREAYADWLAQPGSPPASAGQACPGMPLDERLLVGLRRREGVSMPALLAQAGLGPAALVALRGRLAPWISEGLLRIEGPRWRLSDPAGLALSNGVLRELLAWWQEQE